MFTARLNGIRLDFKAAKIIPLSCFYKRGFLNHSKKSQWCLYWVLGKLIESAESPSRKQSISPIARNIKSIFKPPRLNAQGKKALDMLGITFWACNTERIKDFRVKLLRVGTSYHITSRTIKWVLILLAVSSTAVSLLAVSFHFLC